MFDSYYNSSYKSASTNCNARIYKSNTSLSFDYDSGISQGSNITWNTGINMNCSSGDISMPSIYSNVISSRAVYVDSNGELGTISSLKEHKMLIKPIVDYKCLYKLNPIQFKRRLKVKKNKKVIFTNKPDNYLEYGYIAQDVYKVNKELCEYDENKKLSGVRLRSIIALNTKCIQEQKKIILRQYNELQILRESFRNFKSKFKF